MSTETTKIASLVRAFVDQLQDAENAAKDVRLLTRLENASGEQLDGIGQVVGEDRLGRADTEYRVGIGFRIFLNGSAGEPETLIAALRYFTQTDDVQYWELYPAAVQMRTGGSIIPAGLKTTMQGLCPAAVRMDDIIHSPDDAFIVAGGEGTDITYIPPDTLGLGFGDTTDLAVGGLFSELITT